MANWRDELNDAVKTKAEREAEEAAAAAIERREFVFLLSCK